EGLLLVLALQCAVVALVEPPRAAHRDPVPVGDVQRDLSRADGPPQHRGVHEVRQQVVLAQQLAAAPRLRLALRAKIDVNPAGEEVLGVPFPLAVAQQPQRPTRPAHATILGASMIDPVRAVIVIVTTSRKPRLPPAARRELRPSYRRPGAPPRGCV